MGAITKSKTGSKGAEPRGGIPRLPVDEITLPQNTRVPVKLSSPGPVAHYKNWRSRSLRMFKDLILISYSIEPRPLRRWAGAENAARTGGDVRVGFQIRMSFV
jgi:hypothetical protein